MMDPMLGFTLGALMDYLPSLKEPPKGLFQTNHPVGMLYPIVKENGKYSLINVPTENYEKGEMRACEIMDGDNYDFYCWAIDPWTGEVNIEFSEQWEEIKKKL